VVALHRGRRSRAPTHIVAITLNNFFNTGGALPPAFVLLSGLTGSGLDQLSGEAATGTQQGAFRLGSQFLGLMLGLSVDGRSGVNGPALGFAPERPDLPDEIVLAYSKVVPPPPALARLRASATRYAGGGYGGEGCARDVRAAPDRVGRGPRRPITRPSAAIRPWSARMISAPRATPPGSTITSPATLWRASRSPAAAPTGHWRRLGGGRSDAFQAGVYAAAPSGPAYLAASLAFANHWMSRNRFAALRDHLTTDFKAHSFGVRAETGYRLITPHAAVQMQSFRTPNLLRNRSHRRRLRPDLQLAHGARHRARRGSIITSDIQLRGWQVRVVPILLPKPPIGDASCGPRHCREQAQS
jgi:hypothetical protein